MKRIVLILVLGICLLFTADTLRVPENQWTAAAYIGVVHKYQEYGRPMLDGVVACRFRLTCSDYSIQAVTKYGIAYGLYLTVKRLASCTNDTPMGSIDEVP